jgi:hypothetical protein
MTRDEVATQFKLAKDRAPDLQRQNADAAQKAGLVLSVLETTAPYSVPLQIETAHNMKQELRRKLARKPYAQKIRKVAQLIRLAKTFPRRTRLPSDQKST